ncbi:hypothetical protein KGD83_16155 [Nocardiopsis akebiae]|uniref:Secreted protein n=1 Tax=Nocardiopsis akebiae TaxID=2831968 RepID=A0ABX8BXI1_9ACTN|nr:hypothetical protein [Nocardiopsis akebiae]QUX26900.1 hypothetical protein KGD83_16155 [Nocardiopsis akebiae]
MNRARWIWAAAAIVAIFAALGAGLWFGGGPGTRDGWEAASWSAGITTTLALIVTAIAWATPAPPPRTGDGSDIANTVNGHVSESTVVQGRDMHMENTTYGGDHIDFRGGTFHGTVIGKQTSRPWSTPNDEDQDPER